MPNYVVSKYISSLILASLCFAAALNPNTAAADHTYHRYGAGNASCGNWVAEKNDPVVNAFQLSWVLGYATGVGYTSTADFNETDSEAIRLFVSNYCQSHPLENVIDAARVLMQQLKK